MASKLGRTFLRAVLSRVAAVPVRCSSSSTAVIAPRLQTARSLSSTVPKPKDETVTIHFVDHVDGTKCSANAKVGDNLLDVVIDNDLDIDGFGACEGTLACSTCHLVFKPEDFSKLPDDVTDEELDMLDLAYGLCDTSRLGCQVLVTKDMQDWELTVPSSVSDARSPS